MAQPQFHSLQISAVRPLTDDSVAVRFDVPEELAAEFSFVPGQYLTLRADVDGEDIRRSYSICSALDAGYLEVGIKQVYHGAFSNFAAQLNAGDRINVMPPQGRFTCATGGRNRYLLIAAGSGITPCLSIASSVLEREPESEITLLYGNQTMASIMFKSELEALKDRYTNRFLLNQFLSRERHDQEIFTGRIDGKKIAELQSKQALNVTDFDAVYLCGPVDMIEGVEKVLDELGCGKERIKRELFATGDSPVKHAPVVAESVSVSGADVTIRIDGSEKFVAVDASQDTVLSAARRAGLDLPFSCAGGMCCTCRCKVVEGAVEMDVNYALEDWELEAGYVLACQSRPRSDTVTLDFDAV